MSEEVKLILGKEIKKAKYNERSAILLFLIGVVAVLIGFFINTLPYASPSIGTVIAIVGVIMIIVGLGESLYNVKKKGKLVKEFWTIAENPTCPKCGKAIPQGNYTFCPFCGSPLTRPPP